MNQKTIDVLNIFENFRTPPVTNDEYESKGKMILAEKIDSHIIANKPIDFVMLGFPFKSTNHRDKTLGDLPDKAEEETLRNFARFNERIKGVYSEGMKLHLATDGFVFNELLDIPERTVIEYKEASQEMGKDCPVAWYDLRDFYTGQSVGEKLEKLVVQFGITPETLQQEIMFNPDTNYLYRGITRFIEEELVVREFASGKQFKKTAKAITRQIMIRNEAYSNLVRHEFGSMIRLSMHPSVNNGNKYSFQLIPSPNARHSAWHSALVINANGELATMHRKDAEARGFALITEHNRPYYFYNPENTLA